MKKRLISVFLTASILVSFVPNVFAQNSVTSGESEISFSAAKYNVAENERKFKVKILRAGGNDRSVRVAFKTADFMANYGEDYVVLDSDGKEIPITDGIAPTENDFKQISQTHNDNILVEGDSEETVNEKLKDSSAIITEDGTPTTDVTAISYEENEVVDKELTAALEENEETIIRKKTSTGSSLLDAQANYLNLTDDDEQKKESIETALTDINEYFNQARGAIGIIDFDEGEREQEITVKLIDNDDPGADKIVMLSLMGVSGDDNTKLSANPTSYINIIDDEEYEKPIIEPDTDQITLTSDNNEYELKLSREVGVDYYTSLYVSTVKETAEEGIDYDIMKDVSVAFAPGERTKVVKISAKNFDKDKSYGIRLENDGTCDISNEYIKVNIKAENKEISLMGTDDSVDLMAAGYVGTPQTDIKLDSLWMVYGPYTGDQDGWHGNETNSDKSWTDYYVYEKNKNSGRTWVARNATNVNGINSLRFMHRNNGDKDAHHLFVELLRDGDKNNYHSGGDRNFRVDGRHGWRGTEMNVSDLTGDYYVRFGIRNDGKWLADGRAWMGNPLTITWKKYSFDTTCNKQYFTRVNYNYDTEDGKKKAIDFEEENSRNYDPGTVKFVTSTGKVIDSFYANSKETIKPVAVKANANSKYRIELEGVYLYIKNEKELYNKDQEDPYEDHWNTSQTVWIPAEGVKANQELANEIVNNLGNRASTIKVMPKFKQRQVAVKIYNADNAETYIANLNNSNQRDSSHHLLWNGSGYYNKYYFPYNSTITVRAVPAPRKTIKNFYIELLEKSSYKYINNSDGSGIITYTLMEDTGIHPQTENQDLNIAYMPGMDKVVNDLTGRVYHQTSTVDKTTTVAKSDKQGNLKIESYTGMMWMMRATAPEGYYVKWTNGTGDIKNINGKIDVSHSNPYVNEENENTKRGAYIPVYGDIMSGRINQFNTKYYYEFVKNDNKDKTGRVYGNVQRETGSFYDVLYKKKLEKEPVSATQLSVAGSSGFTNSKGDFVIDLKNVPISDLVSVIIDDEGTQYPCTALANYMSITLPAYECFKPISLDINYNKKGNADDEITGKAVNIQNNILNISAEVANNGAIYPRKAKYYIYKLNGQVIDCSQDSRFTINTVNNKANMSFNPKSIMDSGDRIYVAFIDQNNKEYKAMDIGYIFISPLNLKSFVLPPMGSSLAEENHGVATDLIGDPLGDASLGTLGIGQSKLDMVKPPGSKNEYAVSTYSFGDFSKALKTFKSSDSKDKGKTESQKAADKTKDAVENSGKKTDGGGYKTNKSFSWQLSPKAAFALQISSRMVNGKQKYYFEELDFLVGLDFNVSGKITITLPIGMNIIISGSLSGDIAAIYQLKTDYGIDPTWDKNKVEYSHESFGLFDDIKNVDRTIYIMVNPKISLGLGISYAIIEIGGNANFAFDMDFKFGVNAGKLGSEMYGDMKYNFDYYINVLSITVYSGETKPRTVSLFSKNADGHIEPDIIAGLLSVEGDEIQSIPVTREYLTNSSQWNSYMNNISLMDIGASDGTTETTLQEGVYPSSKFKLTKFGDENILMTFIGDVASRSDINRTGLFYSIYDGTEWSVPALIDDDGTLDDYVNVFDLGNKIMVSWSSADRILEDTATAAEALTSLDIKTTFFDKQTKSFEEVVRITHTTDEDYTADVDARASYDEETDRIILYYTKTEFKDMTKLEDIIESPSVIAYRFFENDKWNDESSYTDDELSGIENKESYKTNWYGQRFLDVRINKDSGEMLRVVDSDAVSYNGLALYAWTVDYDKDLNTVEDRDIFLQIYNFSENSFTHIIKITVDSGAYSTPHFGRYNDETYLFFSAEGDLGNGEEGSGIAYINVSDAIRENHYTLIEEGTTKYYKLQYQDTVEEMVDSGGMLIPAHEVTLLKKPGYAVKIDGYVNNYSVDIDENERMYLTWVDSVVGATIQRQVFTSVYDVEPISNEDTDGEMSENTSWSEPFMLTEEASIAYSNIDAAVINSELYVAANKAYYIEKDGNTSLDEANTDMVILKHVPYSKPMTVEKNALSIDTNYVYPNVGFNLTSTVKNEGVKFINEPVTFKITMTSNGETTEIETKTLNYLWGAGKNMSTSVNIPAMSQISDDLRFNAEISIGDTIINQEMKAVKEYDIILDGDAVINEFVDGHELSVPIRNNGNIPSDAVSVKLYTSKDGEKDTLISTFDVNSIAENVIESIGGDILIPDEAYIIDNGDGVAELVAVIEVAGEELETLTVKAHKIFNAEAISIMSKVTGFSLKGSDEINAEYLDDIDIETEITGTANDDVKVFWESDNEKAVYVREDNTICAVGNGKATLTGYVVPSMQNIVFNYDGTPQKDNLLSSIPSTMHRTITAEVTVTDAEITPTKRPSSGRGGSKLISTLKPTLEPTLKPIPEPTFEPTQTNVPEDNTFDDIQTHWAEEQIKKLANMGIVNGTGNRIFEPDENVTRAEFIQMLMKTDLVEKGDIEIPEFDDIDINAWYAEAVSWVVSCGVANGVSDDQFEPETLITREQMAAMVNRFIKLIDIKADTELNVTFTDSDNISDWAIADVEDMAKIGIIKGRDNGEFDPQADMTRAEGAIVIYNILDLKEE